MGPTNRSASISRDANDPGARGVTYVQLVDAYRQQALGLIEGGVDTLLVETIFDTLNAKAALFAIEEAFDQIGRRVPIQISVTIFDSGRTLNAQTLEAFWISVAHARPLSVGINCALGPDQMRPFVEEFSRIATCYFSCYPNAGTARSALAHRLPAPARGHGPLMRDFAEQGWLNIAGGCCGNTPEHIRCIAELCATLPPRKLARRTSLNPNRKLYVPNTPASNRSRSAPKFRSPSSANGPTSPARPNSPSSSSTENSTRRLAVARQQVEGGAAIIDVNFDEGMLDGEKAMTRFLNLIAAELEIARVPDHGRQLEMERDRGRPALHSRQADRQFAQPEGGRGRLPRAGQTRPPLRRRRGHHGLRRKGPGRFAFAPDRDLHPRLQHSHEEVGFPAEDIIFDPNVLTVATGIEEHNNYAVDFIEATRWIKANLPGARVSGGISNISFSFRGNNPVREAMHAVFLYHAIHAGLDMGIVNAGMLAVYEEIEPQLKELVEDVILNRRPDATERLVTFADSYKKTANRGEGGSASGVRCPSRNGSATR
jgi:5-methyltetrahydrofolate--homocysteine methyltransferase